MDMRAAITLLLLSINGIFAMRILAYFPSNAKSHHYVVQPIIRELASRGHYVLYASPFPMPQSHPNITLLHLEDFSKWLIEIYGEEFFTSFKPINTGYKLDELAYAITGRVCRTEQIQQLIHSNDSYDLVLHSGFLSQEHATVFAHKFKAQGVAIHPFGDSTWLNEMSGLTDNPSYMMGFQVPLTDRMSFFDRLYNIFIMTTTLINGYYYLNKLQSTVDELFVYNGSDTRPSLLQLAPNQSLILVASHHALGYSFPKSPHVKEIGGLSLKESEPLPKEFESFISNATDGVIYFSFGSLLRTDIGDTRNLKNVFLGVFKTLKQRILFKWDADIENPPENVLVSKWFPQQDILGHKNVKLFVTHGGLQSSFETVYFAVPVVSIPFFSDQRKNSKLADSSGYGVMLHPDNITEESFSWAVNEVIHNSRYTNEVKRRSALLRDRPMSPLNEAVYWIEYVHRHGRVLQPAAAHLSFIQLHLLDVYAFIIGVIIITYVLIRFLACFLWRKISSKLHTCVNKSIANKKNK